MENVEDKLTSVKEFVSELSEYYTSVLKEVQSLNDQSLEKKEIQLDSCLRTLELIEMFIEGRI